MIRALGGTGFVARGSGSSVPGFLSCVSSPCFGGRVPFRERAFHSVQLRRCTELPNGGLRCVQGQELKHLNSEACSRPLAQPEAALCLCVSSLLHPYPGGRPLLSVAGVQFALSRRYCEWHRRCVWSPRSACWFCAVSLARPSCSLDCSTHPFTTICPSSWTRGLFPGFGLRVQPP